MSIQKQARRIRARKIGVLIRDARIHREKTLEELANLLAVKLDHYTSIESGTKAPSLPELELLSYYFNLPIEHFWGSTILGSNHSSERALQPEILIPLRQRMIGVILRQKREKQDVSLEELSLKTEISEEQLLSYEMGEIPVPVTDIQSIAGALDANLDEFIDVHGPYGSWRGQQTLFDRFMELPDELREFILKPVNRPYMDIAKRLSELSTKELRQIAESLLEITY